MPEISDLQKWRRGERFSAERLNEAWQLLQQRGDISGGRNFDGHGGSVYQSGGVVVGHNTFKLTGKKFIGKIVGNGPAGDKDPDFTDNRYWVQVYLLNATGDNTKPIDLQQAVSCFGLTNDPENDLTNNNPTYINTVYATNLGEQKDLSHNLAFGTYVEVIEVSEIDQSPQNSDAVSNDQSSQGTGTVPQLRWMFYLADVGVGQYQFQIFQTVAQRTRGWDYLRASAMPGS